MAARRRMRRADRPRPPTFQEVIARLEAFWRHAGCVIAQPYDMEVGAGTFHPATFFRVLGPAPWRVAFVQPSRRPADGRFGKNPLRMQHYYQYQVILKPAPADIQDLYLRSLEHVGVELAAWDLRFVEDDWESPTLGAGGLGWEVWCDSLEITQFTYFQKMAGLELPVVSGEITYGLERIARLLQGCPDVFALQWTATVTYGEVHRRDEEEYSAFNFEVADVSRLAHWFDEYEAQAAVLVARGLVRPAYDFVLKMSHAFNLLDARGAIGQQGRPDYIRRVREQAKACAQAYVARSPSGGPADG